METIILLGVFAVLYAVLFLPQIKKRKEMRELLASLSEGDEVVTASGLHGLISALDDSVVYIEVAEGVEIKLERSAIATKVSNEVDLIS